jgi:potassium efflux system protein
LAMIIGLAVQANIANVFSGIVLNIERPFKVGDFVKINNIIGQIMDITWRTVRVRTNGYVVSLANGKVSEAEVHNYSTAKGAYAGLTVFVSPSHDPKRITAILQGCLDGIPEFVAGDDDDAEAAAYFAGVECVEGHWVARYNLRFCIQHMGRMKYASQMVWTRVWERFRQVGLEWRDRSLDPSSADLAELAQLAAEGEGENLLAEELTVAEGA